MSSTDKLDDDGLPPLRSERCETCRFFYAFDKGVSGLADCRRYPPTMGIRLRGNVSDTERPQDGGWPFVFPEDWCGEFQRAESEATHA